MTVQSSQNVVIILVISQEILDVLKNSIESILS